MLWQTVLQAVAHGHRNNSASIGAFVREQGKEDLMKLVLKKMNVNLLKFVKDHMAAVLKVSGKGNAKTVALVR